MKRLANYFYFIIDDVLKVRKTFMIDGLNKAYLSKGWAKLVGIKT